MFGDIDCYVSNTSPPQSLNDIRRGGDLNSREAKASRALQARAVPVWATSAL